jgi:hypothetical protein
MIENLLFYTCLIIIPEIRNPEMTKNTSTPKKPPGMKSGNP